jgi:6-phosphogluconolactonase
MTPAELAITVLPDEEAVALRAAEVIADLARRSVKARGRFIMALSGGRTPWRMLEKLAAMTVPWTGVQVVQVDERVAPAGDPSRNLTHLHESLLVRTPLTAQQIHAMPVENPDLAAGAAAYAATLATVAGAPVALDLVHLGLGPDGHTASLVPGDPALHVADRDVAPVGVYQGHRRMTLTYPVLNRATRILWVVTGAEKQDALGRLRRGETSQPAGRVSRAQAEVVADALAAGEAAP